jgi:hypothetical protein
MQDLPACTKPHEHHFTVERAWARRNLEAVNVLFSKAVNPPTAKTIENYTIMPDVEVQTATVDPTNSAQVELTVAGLVPGDSYMLVVKNVLSEDNVPIDPQHDTATFKTPNA